MTKPNPAPKKKLKTVQHKKVSQSAKQNQTVIILLASIFTVLCLIFAAMALYYYA